jgi:hypothetical protein
MREEMGYERQMFFELRKYKVMKGLLELVQRVFTALRGDGFFVVAVCCYEAACCKNETGIGQWHNVDWMTVEPLGRLRVIEKMRMALPR